jgi:hypothetical protein
MTIADGTDGEEPGPLPVDAGATPAPPEEETPLEEPDVALADAEPPPEVGDGLPRPPAVGEAVPPQATPTDEPMTRATTLHFELILFIA